MKTKLLITLFLFVSAILSLGGIKHFEETGSALQVSSVTEKEFMIGAMDNAWDINYYYLKDTLNMNTWLRYSAPATGWLKPDGTLDPNDVWDGDPALFESNVTNRIASNNSEGLRTVMDRPIIEYLSYGQRSDYQAEPITEGQDYWFYSYATHSVGTPVNDTDPVTSEEMVSVYCSPNHSTDYGAGWVVKDLKANREQANKDWNDFQSDFSEPWYVKPRIRIDSDFANNPANYGTLVCRIDVLNWDGDTIKRADIKVRNFKSHPHPDSTYNGNYIDEFYFTPYLPEDTSSLFIPEGAICPGGGRDFLNWWEEDLIKTDFRVHWYGTCEMWIDYVRVENEPSRLLHSEDTEELAFVTGRIEEEVEWAVAGYNPSNPVPNNFYIEEYEFNITPSLKRVNELIEDYSEGKLSLMTAFNYDLYRGVMPYYWDYTFDESDIRNTCSMRQE